MSKARHMERRVIRPNVEARPSQERLWCLINPQETVDEIVEDVSSTFADELAELIRASKEGR